MNVKGGEKIYYLDRIKDRTPFDILIMRDNAIDKLEREIDSLKNEVKQLKNYENRPDQEPVSLYELKEMYRAENREQHAELERLSKENERLKKLLKNYQERVVYSGFCQGCKHIDKTTPCKECNIDNYLWELKE